MSEGRRGRRQENSGNLKSFSVVPGLGEEETIIEASKVDITPSGAAIFYGETGVILCIASGHWHTVEQVV